MTGVYDLGLAALVLAVAGWTIATRATSAAVIGFVAYGLLLALVWMRLHAVDVAMTEAAIGSGLTGVLLLGAARRLRAGEAAAESERPGPALRLAAAALATIVAAAIATAVVLLPEPAPTLAPQAAAGLPAVGVGNPVTAVLMSYRAMDTLLEKVVLLLALIAVWSLAADRDWGGRPGPAPRVDAGALAFLARVLPPLGIVVGVYILWVSADEPGGAFQGGTILAAMWMLTIMAGLADAPPIGDRRLRLTLIAGTGVFLAVGLAGIALAGGFLAYPPPWSKGLILVIEFPMLLTVAVTLALLLAGPPRRAGR